MNNASLRNAILTTLASWGKLDDARKGPGYGESVARLANWADELEREKQMKRAEENPAVKL